MLTNGDVNVLDDGFEVLFQRSRFQLLLPALVLQRLHRGFKGQLCAETAVVVGRLPFQLVEELLQVLEGILPVHE